jgi:hypothetical protein
LALVQAPDIKAAIVNAGVGVGMFVATLAATFSADPYEMANFAKYAAVMSRHGLSGALLISNLVAAMVLAAPYGVALWQRSETFGLDWRTVSTAGSMALSGSLLIVVGAKPGAGAHHMMPLIPVLLLLTLTAGGRRAIKVDNASITVLAAMITAAVVPLADSLSFLWSATQRMDQTIAAQQEAANLTARYPGAQFGPTDMAHYDTLKSRVGAALRGARLTFDMAA